MPRQTRLVKNCAQLAEHFVATIEQKYGRRDEVRLICDRYDVTMSIKEATRENYKKVRTLSTIGSQIPPKSQVPMKKEGLPGVFGNKGTLAKYRREQGNISQFL